MRKGIIIGGVAAAVAIIAIGIGANSGKTSTDTANAAPAATTAAAASSSSAKSTPPSATTVTLPSLSGLTAEVAAAKLRTLGLVLSPTGDLSNPSFGVLTQDPLAGSKVKDGTVVKVTIGESTAQKTQREAAEKVAADKAAKEAADKAAAEAAAAAAAAQAASDADLSTFIDIDSRSWAQIVKNPDAHIGEKYMVYGRVTQFDSATGISSFRADTDGQQQESQYDYEENTYVTSKDAAAISDVVKDDLLKMWVRVSGSKSYKTQIGGSTTVPTVVIVNHELIGTAE